MLEAYDGQKDPTAHLMCYVWYIEVLSTSDVIMEKCFLLYLIDIAAIWFWQLETYLVHSWNFLIGKFIEKFRVHITCPKSIMTLRAIKQKSGETLRKFLKRFKAVVV